jgi:hypothetical protein
LLNVDAIDARNKRNLLEKKDDFITTKRKQQREEGRFQAMNYFDDTNEKILTWAEKLLGHGKMDSYDGNADAAEYSCHLEHEVT